MSDKPNRRAARKLAEWVSLGISIVLIVALAAYLVYEIAQGNDEQIPINAEIVLDESEQVGRAHIVPVRVANVGRRTVRDLMLSIEPSRDGAAGSKQELTIDYLSERAQTRIFCYFDNDPRSMNPPPKVAILSYRLE